jgi:hypothetical protein
VPPCPACRTPDLCAYNGCGKPSGTAVGFAHAPLRPILLPGLQGISGQSRPSPFSRLLKRWTYGPEADPGTDPRPLHEQVEEIMNAAVEPIPSPEPKSSPVPPPSPIVRGPIRRPEPGTKLEIRIAKSGAAVLVVGAELYDAATDAAGLSEAVRAWYDGA